MNVQARAPGKLVLLGEYAVLEGAPGLVMAVDRHARVGLDDTDGIGLRIDAPPVLAVPVTLPVAGDAELWPRPGPLPLLDAVVDALVGQAGLCDALTGRALILDSGDFHAPDGTKLGLGSSAALCTALLGALHAALGLDRPELGAVLAAHERFQHGAGSGIDAAASVHGGVLGYTRAPGGAPRVEPLPWPADLHGCAVFSGAAASTTDRLARLADWRARQPQRYRALMDDLGARAAAGADAFAAGDAAAFLEALDAFTAALAAIDRAAGLWVLTPAHRKLARIAARHGLRYKTSGAGGGDFGLAFGAPEPVADFGAEVAGTGRPVLPLTPYPVGLSITTDRGEPVHAC